MFDKLHQYLNSVALISEESGEVTYNQLINNADRIGSHVRARCLAFIVCTNCVESVYGYVGILRANAVVLLLNENFENKFVERLLQDYKPDFLYCPALRPSETADYSLVDKFWGYVLLKRNRSEHVQIHHDLALLMTTSGTTGSRKVVRLTKRNLISNTESIASYLGIQKYDRAITTMPMSYSYGLSIINSHLYSGASIVISEKTLLERRFWELWTQYRPTSFSGVPYLYEVLLKMNFEDRFLLGLRYLTQAGGRLRPKLAAEIVEICQRNGVKMYFMYGQTEAAPRMGYLPWESVKKIGSIGMAIPSGKFWLVDDEGSVINGAGVIGELVYQGPNVGMGYAESVKDLSKPDENNGILKTGDLAKRDNDGFYYLVGRKSRFVKLFGNRIDLDDLEELISSTGCECACIESGEDLKIFLTDGSSEPNVRTVLKKLGIHRKAVKIQEIQKIPRNEFGKISYSQLV